MAAAREAVFGGREILTGVRAELGLPQRQFAELLGCSIRTVQSAEQGWRKPGAALEKLALLLLASIRHGADLSDVCCWERRNCAPEQREQCLAHRHQLGHVCWLTSTACGDGAVVTWDEKKRQCLACEVLRTLVR